MRSIAPVQHLVASILLTSNDTMANLTKRMLIGSIAVAGIVALASVVDMITGYPFDGRMMLDIMFLIGAAITIYLGYDSFQDLR